MTVVESRQHSYHIIVEVFLSDHHSSSIGRTTGPRDMLLLSSTTNHLGDNIKNNGRVVAGFDSCDKIE